MSKPASVVTAKGGGELLTTQALLTELREFIDAEFEGNKAAAARHFALPDSHIHDMLADRRPISTRILAALGYERTRGYRKIST